MSRGKMLRKTRSAGKCPVHGAQRLKDWGHRRCDVTDEIDEGKKEKARTIDKRNTNSEINSGLDEYDNE